MSVVVDIGTLDRRLKVQASTSTRDEEGEAKETWSTVKTVYGSREPLRGREFFDAQTTLGESVERVVVRHDPSLTLTADHRLVDQETSEVLEIAAPPKNLELADQYLELMVVVRADD